jgi:hypothetical protein
MNRRVAILISLTGCLLGLAMGSMFLTRQASSQAAPMQVASEGNANSTPPSEKAAHVPAKEELPQETPPFETLTLRGKVRYLGPALKERYDIESVPESAERQIVLDIPDGELVPLVEDIRGRAFRVDDRLRGMEVELLVRRYQHSPFAQVIQLSEVKKAGLFIVDYWCDVCAIAMYELKPCDCCQAPNRLRLRRVTPEGIANEEQ